MADLDDLGYKSITEMSLDEALELERQIRLSRRTPTKPPKKITTKKAKAKDLNITADQAAELLKLIGGDK